MHDRIKLPVTADTLLGLLHSDITKHDYSALSSVTPGGWESLAQAAIDYRLAYRFRQTLGAVEAVKAGVPEVVWQSIDESVRQTRQINIRRLLQLRHFAAACDAEGIPFLLMKGLWLVEVAYRDISARNSGDIDILVQPEDMYRFTALMSRLGFDVPVGVQNLRELMKSSHEFALIHCKLGTSLDIHWAMTHPWYETPVDDASFWSRAETYPIAGHPILSLGLEDHLLLLCFHAVMHHHFMYVGPRILLDVAQVIAYPPRAIDWGDFVCRAQSLGWDRAAWLMLELTRQHVGVQPPNFVMHALRPLEAPSPDIFSAAVEALFLDQPQAERFDPASVALLTEGKLWLFVRSVLRRLFAQREHVVSYSTNYEIKAANKVSLGLFLKRYRFLFRKNFPMFLGWLRSDPARLAELQRSKILLTWLNAERDHNSQNQNAESTQR